MDYQEEGCLFCDDICWEIRHLEPARFLFSGSRYLGKDCPSLESQLKQLFILRRILDVPSEWCEEKLRGSEGVNPSNWFGVCGRCSEIVEEAVDVHHKILKLEGKFLELKEKVKEKMGWGRSRRRKRRGGRGGEGGIGEEIRRMVVGEAVIKVERTSYNYAEFDDENYDDFNYQPEDENSCSNPEWNEEDSKVLQEDEEIFKSQSDISKLTKRKRRGRPPRGEERPRGLYVGNDGKVRRVTFHLLPCSKCPAKYKRQEDLNAHLALHDSSTNLPCPECSFPCKNQDDLERHHKAKHEAPISSSIPRYGCTFQDCKFTTYSSSILDNHYENEHPSIPLSDLKRIRCPPCSKTFKNQKSLSLHQHHMHPELFGMEALNPSLVTRGPIQCEQCGLYVISRLHLDDHVRNTHERVQRHICEECGKGFKFKCHLESHMIVHKKEREFVCHHCGLDYPAKQTLVNHIRKVHSENSSGLSTVATGKNESEGNPEGGEDSGEIFTCKYCELTSPFKVVIRRHQLTHKVEMGHQCDICQKCYTSVAGLKRHVRINHPTQVEVVECPFCKKPFGNKDYMNDHMKKFCQVRKDFEGGGGGAKGGEEEKLETTITPALLPFKIESSGSSDLCDV
ncbi:unnamed protein product [Orchesella dallaii]|uniref:C2H2-type domain-containing protein n=1 Tax=Orchesella dallaii TaxID=48710 RepID=A0ABP1QG40_9HEXA